LDLGDKRLDEEVVVIHLHVNFLAIRTAKARISLFEALRQLKPNMFKARLVAGWELWASCSGPD
jgi:hypothetical protein